MILQGRSEITSEEIYEDLCFKIEKLVYMPGQKLSENELCENYCTSRHMVRGALAKLKQRRLVEVLPQRGTFVSLIDMSYINELLFLREALEQETAIRIIEKGDTEILCKRMENNIELQKEVWNEEGYSDEFYKLDTLFHRCMFEEIGMKDVISMMGEPYIHVRRWRNLELRSAERMRQLIKEHEMIVDAFRMKDKELLREQLHMHLDTVGRYGKRCKSIQKEYFY